MNNVDERIVDMQFNNGQFEKGVDTSLKSLDNLKKGLNLEGAAKGLTNLDKVGKSFSLAGIADGVNFISSKFTALGVIGITALQNIANSAVNAGKRMVAAFTIDPVKTGFKEYETQINAIQTVLANTKSKGTTLDQVNEALDQLNLYADKTIYNFTEMTKNIGTFTAAGISLDTSVSAIKGIANLAAVSGSNSQQASAAMYQLSQALASGTVKLMDWNSVVNAGMGGQVFQDALKETARVHKINIDKMIKDEGSFRETLKDGWLTSAILTETLSKFTGDLSESQILNMGYTKEQAKAIMELGVTANDAATKVKTFTQLFDTLKEAAQSGWTQSWEIIVGDFEEAKALLTEISNVLGGLLGDSAEARNAMLRLWKYFGGRTVLIEAVRNAFEGLASIIKPIARAFTDVFPPMTGKKLYEITTAVEKLTEKFKIGEKATKNLHSIFENLFGFVNRTAITAFETLHTIVKRAIQAFKEIFPPTTLQQVTDFVDQIKNLTIDFSLSRSQSIDLKNVFKGLFAILDIGIQAFSAIAGGVKELIEYFGPVKVDVLDIAGSFGKFITSLDRTIKETDIFNIGVQKAVDFIKTIPGHVKTAIDTIVNTFNTIRNNETVQKVIQFLMDVPENLRIAFEKAAAIFEQIKNNSTVQKLGEFFTLAAEGVKNAVLLMADAFNSFADTDMSGLDLFADRVKTRLEPFTKLGDMIKTAFDTIAGIVKKVAPIFYQLAGIVGDAFKALQDRISDALGNADFSQGFDILNGGLTAGLIIGVTKFIDSLKGLADNSSGFLEGFKGIVDGVKDSLSEFQSSLKAGTLLKIAAAIAILAAAVIALSLVDSEKLTVALTAISALFIELFASLSAFSKIVGSDGLRSMGKLAGALIGIATAVLILSVAMTKLAELDWEGVAKGLISIAALMTILVKAADTLSKNSGKLISSSIGLIGFATAITILVNAVKTLGDMDPVALTKGLVGVGVIATELALFLKVTDLDKMGVGKGIGLIALSAAILILSEAVKRFAALDPEQLLKGLLAVGVVLGELAAFVNLTGDAKKVISTGIGLIAIAAAMLIFAQAIEQMGNLSWEQIGKGLATLAGTLTAVTIALNLMPKNVMAKGVALIAIAAAMLIFANAIEQMGNMSWDQVAVGLTTLAGSLVIITAAVNLMPNTMIIKGIGLIAIAAALVILAQALDKMGGMSWDEVARGLVVLAGSLTIISVAMLAMVAALPGAAALLVVAGALAVLTPCLVTLGSMSWQEIGMGLITLAGAFTIIGVAGLVLGPLAPVILALGVAIGILGIGIAGIGVGLMAFATGLSILAVSGTAGAAALVIAVTSIIGLIPMILQKVGEGIILLAEMIVAGAPSIFAAMTVLLAAFVEAVTVTIPTIVDAALLLITKLLESIVEYLPDILQAGMDILEELLKGIAENIDDITIQAIDIMVNFLEALGSKLPDVIQAAVDVILFFINGLADAIRDNDDKIFDACANLVSAIVESIFTFTGKFVEIGENIINGIKQGVSNMAKDLAKSVVDVASKAVTAVKKFLGIKSPSKVFIKIGQYTGEGFVSGITMMKGKIEAATVEAVEEPILVLKKALGDISDSVSDDVVLQPTIRPVVDMTDVEAGLNNTFGQIQSIDTTGTGRKVWEAASNTTASSITSARNPNSTPNCCCKPEVNVTNYYTVRSDSDIRKINGDMEKLLSRQVYAKGVLVG